MDNSALAEESFIWFSKKVGWQGKRWSPPASTANDPPAEDVGPKKQADKMQEEPSADSALQNGDSINHLL